MNKLDKIKSFILLTCSILSALAFFCVSYIKVAYPFAYKKEIKTACLEFSLDESLVRAVINVESGYNELAVSRVGAKGLMQIMPQTARWIASELNIENFNESMLFDSDINIRMGAFYLRYLIDKYSELDMVLFAYNAGEGRLNESLAIEKILKLEDITIGETKEYIFKVKKQLEVYKGLGKLN